MKFYAFHHDHTPKEARMPTIFKWNLLDLYLEQGLNPDLLVLGPTLLDLSLARCFFRLFPNTEWPEQAVIGELTWQQSKTVALNDFAGKYSRHNCSKTSYGRHTLRLEKYKKSYIEDITLPRGDTKFLFQFWIISQREEKFRIFKRPYKHRCKRHNLIWLLHLCYPAMWSFHMSQ